MNFFENMPKTGSLSKLCCKCHSWPKSSRRLCATSHGRQRGEASHERISSRHQKRFAIIRKKRALNEVDLSVPQGSVVGLVGENGTGKTTLLKHVLGLFKARTRSVRVFGKDPVTGPNRSSVKSDISRKFATVLTG